MSSIFRVLLVFTAFVSASANSAEIRDYYEEPGLNPFKTEVNENFNEYIDPFSGRLQLKYTDIHVPGNGGMDININRVYTSPGNFETPNRTSYGHGWTMHFGRIVASASDADKICAQGIFSVSTKDNPSLEHPDGGRELLVLNSIEGDGTLITRSNWRAECVSGITGMIVTAPDGTKYTMDHYDALLDGPSWYTTRIEDVYGNWISIKYEDTDQGHSYIKEIYRSEEGENYPVVTYEYDTTTDEAGMWLLESIKAKGATWHYKLEEVPGDFMLPAFHLVEVENPENKKWKYSYLGVPEDPNPDDDVNEHGIGSYGLESMEYPDGAKIEYTYQRVYIDKGDSLFFTAIETKDVQGVAKTFSEQDGPIFTMGSIDWTFKFETRSSPGKDTRLKFDKTTVTGPYGSTEYYYAGKDSYKTSESSYEFFRPSSVGLLFVEKKLDKSGKVLSHKQNVWGYRKISNENMWHGPGGTYWLETETYAPMLIGEFVAYDEETYKADINLYSRSVEYSDHDEYGNPRTIKEFSNIQNEEDERTTEIEYLNDPDLWVLGNVVKEEVQKDDRVSITTKKYNSKGRLKEEVVNGVATLYEYNSDGDLYSVEDANGHLTLYTDYKKGIPQSEEYPEGITKSRVVGYYGNIESSTDAEGRVTSYSYDTANRLTGIDFPINADVTISYSYDSRTLERGNFKQIDYFDELGRLRKTEHIDVSTNKTITTVTDLDKLGRKIYQSYPFVGDEEGGITFEYDVLDRIIKETNSDGTFKEYSYNDETIVSTDERGKSTTHIYRNIGLEDSSIYYIRQPENINTTFKRNLFNQPTVVTQQQYNFIGQSREYSYNNKFLLESKFDPEIGVTQYTYDAVGNLESSKISEEVATYFHYDGLNRLLHIDYPENTDDTHFVYYNDGNLKKLINGLSTWEYMYDENGNLKEENLTIAYGLLQNYVFNYEYDELDNLNKIIYPNQLSVDYSPNSFGWPTKAGSYASNVEYFPTGQFKSITYGNGKVVNFSLNDRLLLESISSSGLMDLTYSYDGVGNVSSIIDGLDSSRTVSASYDDLNRLTSASGAWGTTTYSYTYNGDIDRKTSANSDVEHFYASGLLTKTEDKTSINLFDYDSRGNIVRKTKYGLYGSGYVNTYFSKDYKYDHASKLRQSVAGGVTKNYFYDGNGQRYQERGNKVYDSKFSVYVNSGALLYEEDYSGCSTTSYIQLGGQLIAQSVDQSIPSGLDSDSDNISDCLETQLGLNPNDSSDASLDSDSDGLSNIDEINNGVFVSIADTDGDGISDGDEVNVHGVNPLSSDSDEDGIDDKDEIDSGLNPQLSDTDRDGVTDGDEREYSLNALDPSDGILDLDSDGYSNRQESAVNHNLAINSDKPDGGELAWYADTSGTIDRAVSVDLEGNLYVGTREGVVYSIYPNGDIRWKFEIEESVLSTPSVAIDGTVYVGANDGRIYAVNPDGTEKWNYRTYGDIQTSPSVASDGTVYVASYDRRLYALNNDGSLKWMYETPGNTGFLSSPAISAEGTIYIGAMDSGKPYLIAVTAEGELEWRYETAGTVKSSPAIGRNGDVYFYANDGVIYSLTKNGSLRWKYDSGVQTSYSQYWSVVLGKDDVVYTGTEKGEILALDRAGQVLWVFDPMGTPYTPVVGENGSVYFGTANGYLYALNQNGTEKWKYTLGHWYVAPPMIDIDGTIYIGDRSSRLQAFVDNNEGLLSSSWSAFGKDRFSSGNQCRYETKVYEPALDSDSDQIPDCVEFVFGLDHQNGADALLDSDADTITNLDEFLAGTSPILADTDGDGLNDNHETLFGTSVLIPDSDGDGILDGNEDYDFDGRSNSTEVATGSNAYLSESILAKGVNFIHYPYIDSSDFSAFDLLEMVGGSDFAEKIERYSADGSQTISAEYVSGQLQGEDFAIEPGQGYVIHMLQEVQLSFDSDVVCSKTQLSAGLNLVGFSCISGDFSAYELLEHLGGESVVNSVQRFNKSTGKYESASWRNSLPSGVDFKLNNTEAYIVYAAQAVDTINSPTDYTGHLVTSHSNGQQTTGSPVKVNGELRALITVTGSVTDNNATVWVNGVRASIANGIFSAQVVLSAGMQNVEVIVINSDNLQTRSVIALDVQQPYAFKVMSHQDGQNTSQSNPIIFGEVDPIIDQVLVNGKESVIDGNNFRFGFYCDSDRHEPSEYCDAGEYSERLQLEAGNHELIIEAFTQGELIASEALNLNVQRLNVSTLNPGVTSKSLEAILVPDVIAPLVDSYHVVFESTVSNGVESNITAANTQPIIVDNTIGTSINVDVLHALSGEYDKTATIVLTDVSDNTLYSVDFLLAYEVPVSTVAPEFEIDSPQAGEDIYYTQGLVSGRYAQSVKEIRVNDEVAHYFENGEFSHSTDLSSGTVTVTAVGETPDLTTSKVVSFNPEVFEVTLAPGESWVSQTLTTTNFPASLPKGNISYGSYVIKGSYPLFIKKHTDSFGYRVTGIEGPYETIDHNFGLTYSDSLSSESGVYNFYIDWVSYGAMGGFEPYMHIPIKLTAYESREAPEVELHSHSDGEVIPSTRTAITVLVSNDTAATVKINGILATKDSIRNVPSGGKRIYGVVTDLIEGANTINVEVQGFNGLSTNKTYTLNVDSQDPPAVEITSHSEGEVVSNDPVSITMEASSQLDGLVMYKDYLAYYPTVNGTTYTWDNQLLEEGGNSMEFYMSGYLDPIATRTIYLTPPAPPVITVTSHSEGQSVSQLPMTLSGKVENPVESLRINGIEVAMDGENFTVPQWDLAPGNNEIRIVAEGPGNHGKTTVHTLNLYSQVSEVAQEVIIGVDGESKLIHEFAVPIDLLGDTELDLYFGGGAPQSLFAPTSSFRTLSSEKALVTVDIEISDYDAPGLYSFPVEFYILNQDFEVQVLEVFMVDLTITEDSRVITGTSILGKERVDLDPAILASVASAQMTPGTLPSGISLSYNHKELDTNNSQALIYYDLSADEDAAYGTYSVPVEIKFFDGSFTELLSITRDIEIEVALPPAGPPIVAIDSHTSGETVTTSLVTITGSIADFNATVLVNGQYAVVTQTNGNEGVFSADITLGEGGNRITVEATGESGLKSSDEIILNLSTTPSGGGLVIAPGDTGISSEPFQFDSNSFYEVGSLNRSMSGTNDAFAAISLSNLSMTPIQGELTWAVGFDVYITPSTSPGDYELSITYTFQDVNGQVLLEETRVLSVEVTE
ncbi:PQQ-binding-like beta-propeller repeat protein [Microbulbifer sp. ZKSA004]|uniref:outer membrane protein assembly factor BamB family protein n=1 Tax=Microbulbifer sp. ZKSA004 TaxID=3243389 RepID=UPI004039F733